MSLFSALANLGVGAINYDATLHTNQTNLDIARETNQTNIDIARERNTMEIEESEKAYQRSTASNQIAELIKTGISEQQARQIVAGSGSPATYQPAPLEAATAVAPTMQPPQLPSGMFDGLGAELGGMFSSSFNQPDGGSLGNLFAADANTFVANNIDKFNHHALSSFEAMVEYLKNSEDPILREFLDSKSFKQVKQNYLGKRAFVSHNLSLYDSGTSEWQYEKFYFDAQSSKYESEIKKYLSLQEQSNTPVIQLQNSWNLLSIPHVSLEQITHSMVETQKLRLQYEQQGKEEFKKYYQKWLLSDIEEKASCAAALQAQEQSKLQGYESLDPTQRAAIAKLGMLNDMGITNEWLQLAIVGKDVVKTAVDSALEVLNLSPEQVNEKSKDLRENPYNVILDQ